MPYFKIPISFSSIISNAIRPRVTISRPLLWAAPVALLTSGVEMSQSDFKITPYTPSSKSWPYKEEDFKRYDESVDSQFYSQPRFVTHIDDHAIAALRSYYSQSLPLRGRILDLCSSWISHLPASHEKAVTDGDLSVFGVGMNARELERNPVLGGKDSRSGFEVQDLNKDPDLESTAGRQDQYDAVTCVVSIDYLTRPVEVLESARNATKNGGTVHLAVSNRCFPTKAVGIWLRLDEEERLSLVADYLWFSGWRNLEIVEVSKPISTLFSRGSDPLWIVRGTKTES